MLLFPHGTLTVLDMLVSQTESHFYSYPRTASYGQFLPNTSAGLVLIYFMIPNGSKRVPQKEYVYSDSPVSYKQRYERGNCQVLVQKREMQIQKAADVGPGRLLCFLSQEQCICKMGIRLIPQPKYQPNRGHFLDERTREHFQNPGVPSESKSQQSWPVLALFVSTMTKMHLSSVRMIPENLIIPSPFSGH